jgi:hypothetical protein
MAPAAIVPSPYSFLGDFVDAPAGGLRWFEFFAMRKYRPGAGVGQPLRGPRDGAVSCHAPVGDRCNDLRGNEGERRQNADVALAETLAFGNLGRRCDAAERKLFLSNGGPWQWRRAEHRGSRVPSIDTA